MDVNIRPLGTTQQTYQTEKPVAVPQSQAEPQAAGDEVSISGEKPPEPGMKKKWTFFLYGAGDNNLSSYIKNNVKDMEKVGSDANTHLVAQLDLSSGDCKRYYLTNHPEAGGIMSPVIENLGPSVNMANPQTLTDAIVWAGKNYPGEHFAVVIGDHGGGTAGAVSDDRDGGHGMMKPAPQSKAIADAEAILGRKIDVVGYDCCLMANTENAFELRNVADFMVASEETEGGAGWPFTRILTEQALKSLQDALKTRINVEPQELVTKIINEASTVQGDLPTLSAIDLRKMDDVAAKIDSFAQAIIGTQEPAADLKSIANKTQSFSEFKDIYDFCKNTAESTAIADEKLKAAAKDVMESLDKAILANEHSSQYPGAHGLQIELSTWGGLGSDYKDLEFAQKTKWPEAVAKISGKTNTEMAEGTATPGGFDTEFYGYDE